MPVNKDDFVEIEYTGRVKDGGTIFDTTVEKVAKDNGIYNKEAKYAPIIICIGEHQILEGLDENLIGKEEGREYQIDLSSANAFGKRDPKLIQLIPMGKFRQQNIQPFPGLQLNIDGVFGIVKTVSGGRCLVDFNHPLAGKDVTYGIRLNKIIVDDADKISSLLKYFNVDFGDVGVENGEAKITLKRQVSQKEKDELDGILKRKIRGLRKVEFTVVAAPKQEKETNAEQKA